MNHYYEISYGNKERPIKTSVKTTVGTPDYQTALKLVRRVNANVPDNAKILNIERILDTKRIAALDNLLTIRRPFGNAFVYVPVGGTVKITLVRHDANANDSDTVGSCSDLVDILSMPEEVVRADCNGSAVLDLMQQIAEEYCEANPNAMSDPTWNNFTNIPGEFLLRYGVSVEPVDTFLTVRVNMDDEIACT